MRPKSIVQFESVYLGVIVLGVANLALSWSALAMSPSVQAMSAQIGSAVLPMVAACVLLIQVLLWYFTARRASNVARWILVLFTAYALVSSVWTLATVGLRIDAFGVIGVILMVLQVIALWLLFRSDAAAWFARGQAEA